MGFSPAAVRKLVFKVQAANVIDASTGAFWYQSVLENTPKIDPARILNKFGIVSSNAPTDQADLINNLIPGALNGIVEDLRGAAIPNPPTTFTQLSRSVPGNDTTYIALVTPGDPSNGRLLNWINPTAVPQPNGDPSTAYSIQLYYFKTSTSTYEEIFTTYGQGSGNNAEVGWVWNYDQGLLMLASNLTPGGSNDLSLLNGGVFPDLYVAGFRYIGTTGGGAGGNVADVLVDQTDLPGYAFDPTTAQTGNVQFTLKPQGNTVGNIGSGTYLGLQALFTGVRSPFGQPISKIGSAGDILKINPSNDDYVWKSFQPFTLSNPTNPANITWYTQYEQTGNTTPTYVAVDYGMTARIVLDKNIVFNVGDTTINNQISGGERCTLIIKHNTDHSFTLTAGQVNGISPFHKVIGAGPNPFNLTNTAGAVDILTGLWDSGDSTMYWNIELNYGGGTAPTPTGNFVELEQNLFLVELEASTGLVELEG